MIVNPDKFKAIVLTKARQDTSGISISLRDRCITSVSLLREVIADCLLTSMLVNSVRKRFSTKCFEKASLIYRK